MIALAAVPASRRAWARAAAAFAGAKGPLDLSLLPAHPRDAQHDLMSQAVDGRLKGHVALHGEAFLRARVMHTHHGSKVYVEAAE